MHCAGLPNWHRRIRRGYTHIAARTRRGKFMVKGKTMRKRLRRRTLKALGVMASLSRPAVSNDNPYSESLFKTLKYRPDHPLEPFADIAAARTWATTLVQWYNHEHRHSAIRFRSEE